MSKDIEIKTNKYLGLNKYHKKLIKELINGLLNRNIIIKDYNAHIDNSNPLIIERTITYLQYEKSEDSN